MDKSELKRIQQNMGLLPEVIEDIIIFKIPISGKRAQCLVCGTAIINSQNLTFCSNKCAQEVLPYKIKS